MGELLTSLEEKCQFHQSINSFVILLLLINVKRIKKRRSNSKTIGLVSVILK